MDATDLKVGGSSPSERASWIRISLLLLLKVDEL